MIHLRTVIALVLSTVIISNCKKKDKTEPTVPATPARVNKVTATVDASEWSNIENGFFKSKSSVYYSFGAQTAFSGPKTSLQVSGITFPCIGTFTFGSSFSGPVMRYIDGNNVTYTSRTGTINITTFDTLPPNAGIINKFKATFSFKTDTINTIYHVVTNGVIDYEK